MGPTAKVPLAYQILPPTQRSAISYLFASSGFLFYTKLEAIAKTTFMSCLRYEEYQDRASLEVVGDTSKIGNDMLKTLTLLCLLSASLLFLIVEFIFWCL